MRLRKDFQKIKTERSEFFPFHVFNFQEAVQQRLLSEFVCLFVSTFEINLLNVNPYNNLNIFLSIPIRLATAIFHSYQELDSQCLFFKESLKVHVRSGDSILPFKPRNLEIIEW